MAFDINDIRAKLAPQWSGPNILILVVLFLMFWPLGLLMLGYILFGERLGLDLGRPETFSAALDRFTAAIHAGRDALNRQPPAAGDEAPDGTAARGPGTAGGAGGPVGAQPDSPAANPAAGRTAGAGTRAASPGPDGSADARDRVTGAGAPEPGGAGSGLADAGLAGSGSDAFERWRNGEIERLRTERQALDDERARLAAERRAFEERRRAG